MKLMQDTKLIFTGKLITSQLIKKKSTMLV